METSINHNKLNLKEGEVVIVDKGFANSSEVTIIEFTPRKMFALVEAKDKYQWELLTSRLSKK